MSEKIPGVGVEESLLKRIRELRTENDVHRRLAEERAQEIQRLLLDNAELSHECDQCQAKLTEVWAEVAELRVIRERQLEQNEALLEGHERLQAEIERLRAALVQIENWVDKLPANMGEAALVFDYIDKACSQALRRR